MFGVDMNVYARSLSLVFLLASSAFATDAPVSVSSELLATRIIYGTQPLILDVRTPAEFAAGHVPGAVNLPYDQISERYPELELSTDAELIVYCRSGKRAGMAEATLAELGFTNLRDLEDHWLGWSDAALSFDVLPEATE
jgi:phage shock protein E